MHWKITAAFALVTASLVLPISATFAADPLSNPNAQYHAGDVTISARFQPDQTEIVLGEPLWFTFTITNEDTSPIQFYDAGYRGVLQRLDYQVEAIDAKGQSVIPPLRGMAADGFVKTITLEPGKTFTAHVLLNDWFTAKQPGQYTITLHRTMSFSTAIIVTTSFPLHVLPTDTQKLGKVINRLTKQTESSDATQRSEAALSLSLIPDARIIPAMAQLLTKPEETTEQNAIQGLAQFTSDAAADALLPALFTNARDTAAEALRRMKRTDRVMPNLKLKLLDSSPEIRKATVFAIGATKNSDGFSVLNSALKDTDTGVRYAAAEALGILGGPRAEASLITHLKDDDVNMRLACIKGFRHLGQLMQPNGMSFLTSALNDPNASVRYAMADALGVMGDSRAETLLVAHLKDDDMNMRLACVKGLLSLGKPLQPKWLIPIIKTYSLAHEYPSLEAMTILRINGRDQAAPALAQCLQFDDPHPSNSYNFLALWCLLWV